MRRWEVGGYERQFYLEAFLFGFVYHKESHTGYLLLVVLNQNTYSLSAWSFTLEESELITSKDPQRTFMKGSCGLFSFFPLCPSIGDICLCINWLVLTDQTDFSQQTPE